MSKTRFSENSKTPPVEIGEPFFVDPQHRNLFQRQWKRSVEGLELAQGGKPLRWALNTAPNPAVLYDAVTDLGLLPVFNFSATSYYARQGLLLPLEQYFPNYDTQFMDLGWRKGAVGGHFYSVPLHLSVRLLFYRKDLLKKYGLQPPLTWAEMEEQAAIIRKGEKDPRLHGLVFNFNPLLRFSIFLDQVWSQGKDLYESTPRWRMDRKGVESAIVRLKGFFAKELTPREAETSDYFWSYKEFLAGHSVFLHNWSDGIRMIRELPPKEQARFGWCLTPCANAKVPGRALVGGPSYVIPKNTRNPKAAGRLLQQFFKPEFQSWYARHLGWPFPGLTDVYYDTKVIEARPYLADAESLLANGKLLEECVYLQQHHLDWQSIGSQEISYYLEGRASSSETVQRMEKRFAPLLPQPPYSGHTGRALEVIQANVDHALTVAEVAKRLQVSPEHLSRVFHAQTGVTLQHQIQGAKIERAKMLLKQSQLSVADVAYRLGFKTPQHFSRLFHQMVKRSPREYRA